MSNKKKLLIIGLDGATWNIIEPLRKKGLLPTFDLLLKNGVWSYLNSTVPPSTFPAWTTFMTGKNPGKHAVYDFTERIHGTYKLRFLNATFRRAKSLWRILSESGLRVGVMGLPVTFPPEDINGFMISGFDSPVARKIDPSFVRPVELYQEIKEQFGDYKISELLENYMNESWYHSAREKIEDSLDKKAKTALYLYQKEPWDCFMVLFGESDTAAHHFWKFYDNSSPRYEHVSGVLSNIIPYIYQKLDNVVERFVEKLWEDTSIIIVSDHGFGGIGIKAISINKWLEQEGFLSQNFQSSLIDRGLELLKETGLKYSPHSFQELVFRSSLKRVAQQIEASSRFSGIQWDRTSAFSEDVGYFPCVHINLQGREPKGIVSQTGYEKIRDSIIEKISAWKDPYTEKPIVRNAWKREVIYKGDYVPLAPDIILDLNTDHGYSYLCLPHNYFSSDKTCKKLKKDELSGIRRLSMSGSHRPEGIFLFSGDILSVSGKLSEGVDLQDICPTVLSFFGIPIDKDMDGRTINIFKQQHVFTTSTPKDDAINAGYIPYTKSQGKKVADRLRNLGYFD